MPLQATSIEKCKVASAFWTTISGMFSFVVRVVGNPIALIMVNVISAL